MQKCVLTLHKEKNSLSHHDFSTNGHPGKQNIISINMKKKQILQSVPDTIISAMNHNTNMILMNIDIKFEDCMKNVIAVIDINGKRRIVAVT